MLQLCRCGVHVRAEASCPFCGVKAAAVRTGAAVLLGLVVGAAGCAEEQALYGAAYQGKRDLDGDGYYTDGEDCDDSDDTIHPGAEETPDDDIDSNCDGEDNT